MTAFSLPQPAKIRGVSFELLRQQASNPLRGADSQAVDMGEAVWICDLETTPLSREQAGEYDALRHKLRGALRTLYVYDATRPRPIAYQDSEEAEWFASSEDVYASSITASAGGYVVAWGAAVVAEYNRTTGQIKLSNLIAGATLTAGDYGAWDDGPARRLVMIVESVTADANGDAWATVEPIPPSTSSYLPAPFTMLRASAEMRVLQTSRPFSVGEGWRVTMKAAQVIRRV